MTARGLGLVVAMALTASCHRVANTDRTATLREADARPELFIPPDLASRPDSALLADSSHGFDTDDEGQPDTLPALPPGMTLDMIRAGDALFHARAGCLHCHGSEAQGLPARGKTLTTGMSYIPTGNWAAIDSLVSVGVPEDRTRSPVAMPARGQHSDLSAAEIRAVSAYVWAVSQARGEPWPGGHPQHRQHDARGSSRTDIP